MNKEFIYIVGANLEVNGQKYIIKYNIETKEIEEIPQTMALRPLAHTMWNDKFGYVVGGCEGDKVVEEICTFSFDQGTFT